MTRRNLLAAIGLTSLAAACAPRRDRVRYRMTVVVDTPEGPRSGSAVRESIYHRPGFFPFPLGEDRGSVSVLGEAVFVELPNGRTLFVLLSGSGGGRDFAARVPDRFLGFGKGQIPINYAQVWPIKQPVDGVPKLVTFANPSDYKTVQPLDPASFSEVLGPGYRLSSITVERTNDPVTYQISRLVPDFGDNETFSKWLRTFIGGSEKIIFPGDFVRKNRRG